MVKKKKPAPKLSDMEELQESSEINGGWSFERVRSFVKRLFDFGDERVAVIIDGPNLLRQVNGKHILLEDLREETEALGRITHGKAIVSKETPPSLLQALTNSGFETIVSSGKVHIKMAVELIKLLNENEVESIVIGSRDAECVPLLQKVKEKGVKAVVLGFNPGLSSALTNTADATILLELKKV